MRYGYFNSRCISIGGLGAPYSILKNGGADFIYYDRGENKSLFWNSMIKKLKANDVLYIYHFYDLDLKGRDRVILERLKKLKELKILVLIRDYNGIFQEIDIEKESLLKIKKKLIYDPRFPPRRYTYY